MPTQPTARVLVRRLRALLRAADAVAADPSASAADVLAAAEVIESGVPVLVDINKNEGRFFRAQARSYQHREDRISAEGVFGLALAA